MSCAIDAASTKIALANGLRISRQMLDRWAKEDGAPVAEAQALPLGEGVALLRRWRANNKRPRSNGHADNGTLQEQLLLAQIDKLREEARAKRLKTDELEGRLVDREDMAREFAGAVSVFRARLEELPSYTAAEFGSDERPRIEIILDERVRLFMHELARACSGVLGESIDEVVVAEAQRIFDRRKVVNGQGEQAASDHAVDGNGSNRGGPNDSACGTDQAGVSEPGREGD